MANLQRYLVYVLRHNPAEIGLLLGKDGFVTIEDMIQGLIAYKKFPHITEAMIREAVETQTDKQRLEIQGNLIRARYGHSQEVVEEMTYPVITPPEFLYHGTAAKNLDSILEQGLIPASRKYVHLSENQTIARKVALRHSSKIVILTVLCVPAQTAGIEFYHPEEQIWLAKHIPAKFLKQEN